MEAPRNIPYVWEDSGSEDLTAFKTTEDANAYYRQDTTLLSCVNIAGAL